MAYDLVFRNGNLIDGTGPPQPRVQELRFLRFVEEINPADQPVGQVAVEPFEEVGGSPQPPRRVNPRGQPRGPVHTTEHGRRQPS